MRKPRSKMRILAIDPGTRELGFALFERGRPLYYGVKTIQALTPHGRLKEAREFILNLVRDFQPEILVSEKAFFAKSKNVSLLNVLVDEIEVIAKRKRLSFLSYAPSTVKKYISGNGRASKREVAKVVVAEYPELKVYLNQDRAWKERYHQNMFDALALGMMALRS